VPTEAKTLPTAAAAALTVGLLGDGFGCRPVDLLAAFAAAKACAARAAAAARAALRCSGT
jgi:hypothetical protein